MCNISLTHWSRRVPRESYCPRLSKTLHKFSSLRNLKLNHTKMTQKINGWVGGRGYSKRTRKVHWLHTIHSRWTCCSAREWENFWHNSCRLRIERGRKGESEGRILEGDSGSSGPMGPLPFLTHYPETDPRPDESRTRESKPLAPSIQIKEKKEAHQKKQEQRSRPWATNSLQRQKQHLRKKWTKRDVNGRQWLRHHPTSQIQSGIESRLPQPQLGNAYWSGAVGIDEAGDLYSGENNFWGSWRSALQWPEGQGQRFHPFAFSFYSLSLTLCKRNMTKSTCAQGPGGEWPA